MVLETLVSVKLLTNEEQDGARHCPHDEQVDRLFAQQQTCSLWEQYYIICIVFVFVLCLYYNICPTADLLIMENVLHCIALQWTTMQCIVSWQCYNMQFTKCDNVCSALCKMQQPEMYCTTMYHQLVSNNTISSQKFS